MTPNEITRRRKELGLTIDELAYALNLQADELRCIEEGSSRYCFTREFEESFEIFEERVFGCFVGA